MRHSVRAYLEIGKYRFGPEYSRVSVAGEPYLDRFILYIGTGTLRLHKFYRGDDVRAPHDHPWWFYTFPLTSYTEQVFSKTYSPGDPWTGAVRTVKRFRFHFRPSAFRHYVIGRADGKKKPFWTFVISGSRERSWGFWVYNSVFVPWRDWK